jgi:long-chain fatty acid transport protein
MSEVESPGKQQRLWRCCAGFLASVTNGPLSGASLPYIKRRDDITVWKTSHRGVFNMRQLTWRLLLHTLLLGLGLPTLSAAISNTETFGGFEFNLNNPGARALGMGGAFLAVADDATAAVANPAGLPILQRPEISAEVKFTEYTNTIPVFTNTREEGLRGVYHSQDFDDHVTTPSFFSFVYPTERFVGAVFVREQVNFKSNFTTKGVYHPCGGSGGALAPTLGVALEPTILPIDDPCPSQLRSFPVRSRLDITALSLGAAVGLNLAKLHPLLPNLGGSLEFVQGSVNSLLQRFDFFDPSILRQQSSVSGSDIDIGFNVGILWKPIADLSVGAVFRRGPKFTLQETLLNDPVLSPITPSSLPPVFNHIQVVDFRLKVPDSYGAGVAYRFFDRFTIALDVVRIRYSQLLDNFQIVFPGEANQYKLDDATEVHGGAEYIFFIRRIPVAVRAGFFTDPDHKIRFTGTENLQRARFPGGKDYVHVTGGVGIVPIPSLQIDFAVNQSDPVKEFVISTVYRF